jgi:hypothetical protein
VLVVLDACLSLRIFGSTGSKDLFSLLNQRRHIRITVAVKGTVTTQYTQIYLDAISLLLSSGFQSNIVMLKNVYLESALPQYG